MKAAIDCGTNTTRLVIAAADGTEVVRLQRVTRLGAGVDSRGALDEGAMTRTLDVLGEYASLLREHGVAAVRVVATSAVRDASNGAVFIDRAEGLLGVRPELLAGAAEGRLAFAGATAQLPPKGDDALDLVVDIGGGSTEFSVGRTGDFRGAFSIDVGCVRVGERFLRRDPPTAEELSQAISVVHAHLDDVSRELPAVAEASRLIGVAGSITTMAAIELGLSPYDRDRIHHFELTRPAAEDVFRTVATEARDDRRHNPGLSADRVDTIVAGALILVTLMRHFELATCLVSERDLLDGLLATV